MWIRFNPTMYKLQDLIFKENAIGDIRAVFADLSENFIESGYSDDHRVINPQLAGGPILDLGPYPLSYVCKNFIRAHKLVFNVQFYLGYDAIISPSKK